MKLYTPNSVLNFGKYRGEALIDIARRDPDYINWCLENLDHFVIDDGTVDVLKRNSDYFPTPEADNIRSNKLAYFYGGNYCSADDEDEYPDDDEYYEDTADYYDQSHNIMDEVDWDEIAYYTLTEGEFGDYEDLPDDFDFDDWRTAMGLD